MITLEWGNNLIVWDSMAGGLVSPIGLRCQNPGSGRNMSLLVWPRLQVQGNRYTGRCCIFQQGSNPSRSLWGLQRPRLGFHPVEAYFIFYHDPVVGLYGNPMGCPTVVEE